MRALVVYESFYGNTARVGEAVAEALRAKGLEVESGPISKIGAAQAAGIGLVVVGGPTHAHGMSKAATRQTAVTNKKNEYPEPTVAPGLREWLADLPGGDGRSAAAFDTRIKAPIVFTGSAAKGIARELEQLGYALVVGPECFLVSKENQLHAGEVDRAASWGAGIAERVNAGASRGPS